MSNSSNAVVKPENRQRTRALYEGIYDLFERVKLMCDGISYEILVEPREPESGVTQRFVINLQSIEDDIETAEEEKIKLRNPDHPLQERLTEIQNLQTNYELLSEKAIECVAKLREQYQEKSFQITLVRRKKEPTPGLFSDSEFETSSATEGSDLEWGSLSNSDTDSEDENEDRSRSRYLKALARLRESSISINSESELEEENPRKILCDNTSKCNRSLIC